MSRVLFWRSFTVLFILAGVGVFLLLFKTGYTINQISSNADKISDQTVVYGGLEESGTVQLPIAAEVKPVDLVSYPDRVTFLLLGIRGEDDPWGGLLTDVVMLASLDKKSGEVVLISIPRDLFLTIPDARVRSKINAAYAFGVKKGGSKVGLQYAKNTVEWVTGASIDHTVLIDFTAFDELLKIVGGVDIYLDKPFVEALQWHCDEKGANCVSFEVPAGHNHLSSEDALYYIRSRYSSSDFDRARREQQVLIALAERATSLGVLLNPVKVFNMLDVFGSHVKTDMNLNQMRDLLTLANQYSLDQNTITQIHLDNSPDGYLVSSIIQKQYVLLPKGGDFNAVRNYVKSHLES